MSRAVIDPIFGRLKETLPELLDARPRGAT